jgi:branched-chain amino acid transport system substrate-binding protein
MMQGLKRTFRAAVFSAALSLTALSAGAAEPVRIGEINSYTGLPAFTIPYRLGWELAVE